MRHVLTSLCLMTSLTAGAAHADAGPVVVELYTSQGCSSCPPADEMLTELASRDDVIALALHVDYWDYIGWADSFANPVHTQRQHDYARAAGSATVYTPQMVIGGVDHVVGSRPMEVADLLQAHRGQDHGVDLDIARDGDVIIVEATSDNAAPMVIQMVRYMPQETVAIGRGENAGQEITYSNIVTAWQAVATWDGTEEIAIQAEIEGDDPVVVLVQSGTNGPILAAAQLR
ncbi:DUF1223 domain-containing protein [Yoonia sp. 208BN28-4]|uniref:DUF1223 domain-containing protein n=1 Tax=Yoonia sp. 208BN28-4 TaxID=3126505 RepID=UPI0030A2ADA9